MVYLCGNFPNGGTAVAEADDLTDPDHMISSVEKLISAGCNMITICPCNDTMLIKVAKLCEENKVYWAVAWRDILDPEVRDVVYASPYFCGTAVQSDLNAGYEAVKAMGEAGMKKIGLISLDKSSSCAALREKGMQKALDEYGMKVVAEARDLQQAADAAQAVESFIVANPDLDGVYIACSMGMNILDGTLSALEQYDPDNHIKISVIDFLTGLDTCFEKDRIICAQGGIYIPVQIACGMLEMNAILNGGRLGGQAWDVPISFGAVGSADEFKDYSKFCEGALPTYTFEELQNLFITYNPDVTGEDIIAWGNAFNLADIYAAHADLAAPVKGPNGVEYVPFARRKAMENKKIVVFGSYVTDLTGRTPKFPTEGETVMGVSFKSGPGGKGSNQAVAAKRAGGDVTLVTRLGEDDFGKLALNFYDKEGIDSSKIIVDKNSDTGAALIIVNEATGQNEIVVIIGACGEFKPEEVQALKETVASAGTVLCQLETNPEATYKVLDMAKQAGVTTVFNPAPARKLPDEVLNGIDYITPNETEAEIITGIAVTGYESASKAADVLLGKGVKNVVITLGNKGYYAKNAQSEFTGAPIQVNVVDTTGAGDAFNGGFTAALAAGMSFEAALIYGNVTGGLAVEKLGTAPAMPYKEEIMAALNK